MRRPLPALAVALALLAPLLAPGHAFAARPSCHGRPATIWNDTDDTIWGTAGRDVIVGTAMADEIVGFGGND